MQCTPHVDGKAASNPVVIQAAYSVLWVQEVGDAVILLQSVKNKDRRTPLIPLCQFGNWGWNTQPRKKMHLVCRWQFGRSVTSILRFSFICLIFLVVNREYHNLQGFCRCLSEFYVSKIQMFALTILLNI